MTNEKTVLIDKRVRSVVGIVMALAFLFTSPCQAGQSGAQPSTVMELRQYTLRPGQRDVLIDLFEREFIESQEELGMKIFGTFRDLDKPDRFVWLRGFRDMEARGEALKAFYYGPVWQKHRTVANPTMLDSDNVLLLHVAPPGAGFTPSKRQRAPKGATAIPSGLVVANLYYFDDAVEPTFVDYFEEIVKPQLKAAGVTVRASYVTETSPNNFPVLNIRDKEHVFVWFAMFRSIADYERSLKKLAESTRWQAIAPVLQGKFKAPPEVLRLQPTSRSELHE